VQALIREKGSKASGVQESDTAPANSRVAHNQVTAAIAPDRITLHLETQHGESRAKKGSVQGHGESRARKGSVQGTESQERKKDQSKALVLAPVPVL